MTILESVGAMEGPAYGAPAGIKYSVRAADGVVLDVYVYGPATGDAVLLIPPVMPHVVYDALVEYLSRYYQVFCCTLRGLAGSGDFDKRNQSLAAHAEDILAIVDHFKFKRPPRIFGWCLGAMIALAAAIRRPTAIAELVLCAAPLGSARVSGEELTQAAKLMQSLSTMIWRDENVADALLEMVVNGGTPENQSNGKRYASARMNEMFRADPSLFKTMFILYHQVCQDTEYFGWLQKVAVPCKVLLFADDEMISSGSSAKLCASLANLQSVKTVPGDHFSILVDPVAQQALVGLLAADRPD